MAAVNDLYRIGLHSRQGQQAGIVVRHYTVLAVAGAGRTDDQIAAGVDLVFRGFMRDCMNGQANFLGATVQKIAPLPMAPQAKSTAGFQQGTVAGDALPTQTSGVISLRTNFAGRRYRGRSYIPFPGEADSDVAGNPSGAYVTRLQLLANAMFVDIVVVVGPDSVTLRPVIFSRKFGSVASVTNAIARPFWGTQRKRGQFGRTNTSDPF